MSRRPIMLPRSERWTRPLPTRVKQRRNSSAPSWTMTASEALYQAQLIAKSEYDTKKAAYGTASAQLGQAKAKLAQAKAQMDSSKRRIGQNAGKLTARR